MIAKVLHGEKVRLSLWRPLLPWVQL